MPALSKIYANNETMKLFFRNINKCTYASYLRYIWRDVFVVFFRFDFPTYSLSSLYVHGQLEYRVHGICRKKKTLGKKNKFVSFKAAN